MSAELGAYPFSLGELSLIVGPAGQKDCQRPARSRDAKAMIRNQELMEDEAGL